MPPSWMGLFLSSGMRGKVRSHRYSHNDMASLEKFLSKEAPDAPKLVVTDGVFSMEGDIVKLPRMHELCKKYGARLYLDEAHAIGVLGKTGRGTEEHYGVSGQADVVMCTFSKSFGSLGGFVAGDDEVIDYIKHFARPLIFSASMPPATIASVSACLDVVEKSGARAAAAGHRAQDRFRLQEARLQCRDGGNADCPSSHWGVQKTLLFWRALFDGGVFANPVLSPAVPPDSSLIRTSYMAIHTDEELDRILEVAEKRARNSGYYSRQFPKVSLPQGSRLRAASPRLGCRPRGEACRAVERLIRMDISTGDRPAGGNGYG